MLSSITVQPSPVEMTVGGTQQMTATGTNADASTVNLTNKVTWGSGDSAVCTFRAGTKGRVTARGAGETKITAAYLGLVGTSQVTVTEAP